MAEHSTHPSSDREAMPHGLYEHDGRLKIVIAGLDQNVRAQAVEAANARLNEELGEGGFTKKVLKGIWKGNVAREYYLAKYTSDAETQIREHENLLQHEGLSAEQYQTATTLRFAHEYDDMLHQGEKRHAVLDQNEDGSHNTEGYALKQQIFRLVEGYAAGKFATEEDFHEEKKRLITESVKQGLTKDHIGEGLLYTDNLLQIAQNVKAMVDYRVATGESGNIDEILSNTDIVLGDARLGARTEAELSPTERIMKKLEGKAFVSETTMVTAVSAVYSVGSWATKTAIGAAGRAVALGLGSGVTAALREKRMLKEERAQHAREMALGKGDPEKLSGRREALEDARYETKSAREMTEQIGLMYAPEGDFKVTDKATFNEAVGMLAESQARIRVSDKRNIDLISYSEVGAVEKERFELDLALAKAKCDLRSFMESATDDELKALGIAPGDIPHLRSGDQDILDFVLTPQIDAVEGMLVEGSDDYEGIAQKDRIYAKVRAGRMGKAFLKGTVLGMFIGTAAQEAAAAALDSQQGFAESALGHTDATPDHNTALEGLFGDSHSAPISMETVAHSEQLGEYSKLNLPEGFQAEQNGNMLSVSGPDGLVVDDLRLTADGQLSSEALGKLNEAGFHMTQDTAIVSEKVPQQVEVNPNQLVENHADETTKVTRDFWYDNGTASEANGGELSLHPPTVGEDGGFVYHVDMENASTTSSGSDTIDWQEKAANGDIKMALSASDGTQTEVFMVDVDANGNAIIPEGSPAAALFSGEGDTVTFNGKYAELVEVAGKDDAGVTHIRPLATDTGRGADSFTDTIISREPHGATTYTAEFTQPATAPVDTPDTLVPPVVPIYSRRGLERLSRESRPVTPPSSASERNTSPDAYSGYASRERLREWIESRSPRLKADPEAKLDAGEELKWYFGRQDSAYVSELRRRNGESAYLDRLSGDTELMVNIPVAGAYEKDNIYRTLSLYSSQDLESLGKTQFVLSVNWKEGANIDDVNATIAEIERAKADFPQLNISYFREEWSKDFVSERSGAIYGTVIKSLYDTSLWSVNEANARGVDVDPLIVTNDADAKAISKNYLAQLIQSRERTPKADVLMGKIHWGTDSFKDYPGFGVVSSFFVLLEDRVRDMKGDVSPASWGPNSAFKVSAVAAVGGVNDGMGAGADSELGKRIMAARRPLSAESLASDPYGGISLTGSAGFVAETARGAWVDSSPERLLQLYKENTHPITHAWTTFNSGGYTPRPDLAAGVAEDIDRDFDTIKARIEYQMSGMLSSGWTIMDDPEVVNAALENLFFVPSGQQVWTITGDRYNRQLKFTPEGEKELHTTLAAIHDSVKEGLEMIDEVYAKERAASA